MWFKMMVIVQGHVQYDATSHTRVENAAMIIQYRDNGIASYLHKVTWMVYIHAFKCGSLHLYTCTRGD